MTHLEKMVKEGKAKEVEIDTETFEALRKDLNEKMEKVHREYIIKARQSEMDASKVIINC